MKQKKFSSTKMAVIAAVCAIFVVFTACPALFSDEKQVYSFGFTSPTAIGVINETAKTIAVDVPAGTNVTALVPIITVSARAIVSPASGVPMNFTNPVAYIVTAEDGSTVTYTVSVTVGGGGGGGGTEPTILEGTIDANKTLPDLGLAVDYIVDGNINVNGNALLTVEPGVCIMFTSASNGISVTANAGLRMVGTADKPIVITGPTNNPNKGSWGRIDVRSNRPDNQFEHVHMINGGSGDAPYLAVVILWGQAKLSMKNCLIDGSLNNGVNAEGGATFTAFENNTIKNCDKYPAYSEGGIYPYRNIKGNNTFIGNTKNYVYIAGNSAVNEDMTIARLSIPYYFAGGLTIADNYTTTVEPGTTMLLGANNRIEVQSNAIFVAEGTPTERITIRGFMDEPGYCQGVRVRSTRSGNKLNYCDLSCGGKEAGYSTNNVVYLYTGVRIEMKNITISKSYQYGVSIENSNNIHITHENVNFIACDLGNVWYENDNSVHSELP